MDLCSRYIVSWKLSSSLESNFCIECLEYALGMAVPAILNTDQGAQFTSSGYTDLFSGITTQLSMDGKGCFWDNIFTERLWRTIKYEEVYPKEYQSLDEAKDSLAKYVDYYNHKRHHSKLEHHTPSVIYANKLDPLPDLETRIR